MKKIVWGMIGCGDVTEVKNGPGLYLAENSVLKGITNRTRAKAEDWVRRHNHGIVYENIEKLLSDSEIDIVYIATTPDTHMKLAIMCAEHGKHCLIEKPLAFTYEDGVRIKEAFDKAGRKAYVAFYRRSLNRFAKVRELMETGRIGAVQAVNIKRYVKAVEDTAAWRMDEQISGGNIFTETDIHAVDFMLSIMGDVETINDQTNTFCENNHVFDSIALNFKFKSGLIGSGEWLYNCNYEVDEFEIVGQDGIIRFHFFDNHSPIRLYTNTGKEEFVIEDSVHVGLKMEQEIVNELNGVGSFSGTIKEALKSLRIMDQLI
jgi:predicted dehydrogenase